MLSALLFLVVQAQAQIRLNEIFINPSATATDQALVDCGASTNGKEWVELFNSSKCDTIDLSCYILASFISSTNNGSFSFPANTKMAPLSFLLVGGPGVANVDIKLSDFCGGSQFCGSSSWSLPDDKGWLALYDASGTIADAVFWTPSSGQPGLLTTDNAFTGSPCRPPSAGCTASGTIPSASSMTPGSQIRYAGAAASQGTTIYRTTDGTGSWQTNGTPTPKSCNGVCVSPSTLNIQVDSFKNESCNLQNGYIAVSGTGGAGNYFYRWNDESENPLLANLTAGIYSVTVQDDSNCAFTFIDTLVNLGDSVVVDLQPNQVTIFAGDQVQLVASTASVIASVAWTPSDGLSCLNCANPYADPRATTSYIVSITDINGCIGTDTAVVSVLKDENSLFVPTGFTPDAFNNNILFVRSPRVATIDFHIFDRWGKEVFASTNQNVGWDGRDKSGTKVNAGVYAYYVNATFLDGKARTIHGNVTLLR